MQEIGEAQKSVEAKATDKFAQTEELARPKPKAAPEASSPSGRLSPQLSCTVAPDDRDLLNKLTLYLSNKKGKMLNTSTIIRSLIRLGDKYKDEMEV